MTDTTNRNRMKTFCASCNATVEDTGYPVNAGFPGHFDLTFRRRVAELLERDAVITAHVMDLNYQLRLRLDSMRLSLVSVSPNFALKHSKIYGTMQLELMEIAQISRQILDLHLKEQPLPGYQFSKNAA
jgi:hypothetical protein